MADQMPTWQLLNEFDFHHIIPKHHGITLVLFGKPDCSSCAAWYNALPRLLPSQVSHLIYIDIETSMALAHEFNLFHLPSIAIYVDGSFHGWLHSELNRQAINTSLTDLITAPAQDEP